MSTSKLDQLARGWRAAGDAPGVVALKALDYCDAAEITPPEWVLNTIVACWRHYSEGVPSVGWEADVSHDLRMHDAPGSLDAAFGVPSRSKPQTTLNAQVRWYGPTIHWYTENGTPKTTEGYEAIANAIGDGITGSQARKWHDEYRKPMRKDHRES